MAIDVAAASVHAGDAKQDAGTTQKFAHDSYTAIKIVAQLG